MGLVLMGPTRRQSQPKAPLDQPAAGQKADESEPPPALSTRGGAEPPTTLQLRPLRAPSSRSIHTDRLCIKKGLVFSCRNI